ncbi:MAG: ADP-ribosylglycohydrolase family protein [Lachnospiraceae bacterium]|nr:ADP-ribosylglycohydrolase family protein [Lachnospiraceae bacterium]
MKLSQYKEKVRGCWLGKNIGGTLGAPFENKRGVFDVTYYTHDLTKGVLPNDDLDLQLVWLNAAERYGTEVDAKILASYWQTHIVAHWLEYGAGKSNIRMGMIPPVSGWYHNDFRNSNGAYIRTEIWACLMPGNPQMAVKYAYEDSIVDHSEEGVYGAIFCAAMESAAFVENDIDKLIDIGLSYIPADCGVARAVQTVLDCYKAGEDFKVCRKKVMNLVPTCFGTFIGYEDRPVEEDIPEGIEGYDAPASVAFAVLGLVYGEGDFDKTICLAVNCGEDTDCAAATAGALYGIMYGDGFFDKKWTDPIGDEIKTLSLDITDEHAVPIPTTISALTQRVVCLMPTFMRKHLDIDGDELIINPMTELHNRTINIRKIPGEYMEVKYNFSQILAKQPYSVQYKFPLFNVDVTYENGQTFKFGESKKITLSFAKFYQRPQWITAKWHLAEDFTVDVPVKSVYMECIPDDQGYGAYMDFTLSAETISRAKNVSILELSSNLTGETMCIPVILICE